MTHRIIKIILAAKISLVLAFSPIAHSTGIPVVDVVRNAIANLQLSKEALAVAEAIKQTAQQIMEYQLQIQQYENMVKNTIAPAVQIWDAANSTMNNLRSATDTLTGLKTKYFNLNNYLSKFGDLDYYRNSPCYNGTGCTAAQWKAIQDLQIMASEAQKRANDAVFQGLDLQQDSIIADSKQLEKLQSAAKSATGRLQALGYANQLASNQTNQLLQIRSLLVTQQNAEATRYQYMFDEEAKRLASDRQLTRGLDTFVPSSGWK
ncbi:MAG: P-type conjugative transfer protein TrbJ [gamma proteobacterium symbiont of Lucinoma myriamae]|nr:P-type conjugative transfer protein TrbJ [gamma proteobacterium symbiont of Lucinoma myriamae]MCU7833404.1 P-type conjugative transfer protein TrbJ [gamma proteobacterium symbiont of Lucinoma myriamae]